MFREPRKLLDGGRSECERIALEFLQHAVFQIVDRPKAYITVIKLTSKTTYFCCYTQGAVQGNPFAQAMLGLMYDKGHGVPQDFILAYKWLDLAASRTRGRERDAFARFRDAVASKMSRDEIAVGQRLALNWAPAAFVPPVATGSQPSDVHK